MGASIELVLTTLNALAILKFKTVFSKNLPVKPF